MAESIRNISPDSIIANPENPRLIFHADELQALQDSIKQQGILVPLTVYEDVGGIFVLLDGERRWRCAVKLALPRIPVIVQPKPDKLTNIMMMFAIHNARKDWDPLPTAYKLSELEVEFARRQGRQPTESELAGLASLSRGEVRRLKNLLALPADYREELMQELAKPRSEQVLTVDVVLEATRGAAALRKRAVVDDEEEDALRRAIIQKYKAKTMRNTVEPRQLSRIARAVERGEVPKKTARASVLRLINEERFTVQAAFAQSVEQADFEHATEQLADRLLVRIREHAGRGYSAGAGFQKTIRALIDELKRLVD